MSSRGRGPDRPAASTSNGLVTFRDGDWNCACAYNVGMVDIVSFGHSLVSLERIPIFVSFYSLVVSR